MFKNIGKALVLCALLGSQSYTAKAGVPSGDDFVEGLAVIGVGIGLAGVVVGTIGSFGLYKSFQWARRGQGAKKYVGISALVGTGLVGAYGLGKLSEILKK